MTWFILFPLNLLCSIVCYLTNWIVVLFADERGELHGLWHLWQTWDDTLDVDWFVKGSVPKFLRYDFDKHYKVCRETTTWLESYGRDKGAVESLGVPWTIKERLQRYACRVLWLTRNCGYGFAFWLFGVDHIGTTLACKRGSWYEYYYNDYCWQFVGKLGIMEVMAGWKLNTSSDKISRSMIAGRIIFRLED